MASRELASKRGRTLLLYEFSRDAAGLPLPGTQSRFSLTANPRHIGQESVGLGVSRPLLPACQVLAGQAFTDFGSNSQHDAVHLHVCCQRLLAAILLATAVQREILVPHALCSLVDCSSAALCLLPYCSGPARATLTHCAAANSARLCMHGLRRADLVMQVYLTSILLFGLVAFVLSLLSIYLVVDNSRQQGYTYTFTSYINGVSARRGGHHS